ncbi:MAG: bifunctional hydroxymethylpyrimidine kinase/phosphomethylpyrimidine kinase [Paraprevotella sp.]|nr:bifunctional hydroxymethylpyrimidine kinase/phosphomethylpyrimidine kinase [Paraprevotella sp.]
MEYIPVLSIAGSDGSGGAGIQADLKTSSALGCYAMAAVTSITVQNTCGVSDTHVLPPSVVAAQVRAILEDIRPRCIKIGMVSDLPTLTALTSVLSDYPDIPIVYDCVMASSSGHPLMTEDAIRALPDTLLPLCTLLTPNLPETKILSGLPLHNEADFKRAAEQILQTGSKAVLIKGGHSREKEACDRLYIKKNPQSPYLYSSPRLDTTNTHGTGCTLSSAISAFLARGYQLPEAVGHGKAYLTQALLQGKDIKTGHGSGPLNHFFAPEKLIIR